MTKRRAGLQIDTNLKFHDNFCCISIHIPTFLEKLVNLLQFNKIKRHYLRIVTSNWTTFLE